MLAAMVSRATTQLIVVGIGTAAVQLDTAVNVAFPAITGAFDLAIDDIRWVVVSYVLTYASLLLIFGRLGDRVGHVRVFRAGLAVTVVAQLLCAWAGSFGVLLAARVLQGVGAAMVLSVGAALTTGLFDEVRRTRVLGRYSMMMGVAGTLGPWIGGALVATWDWPGVFWFRIPVAMAALALFHPTLSPMDPHAAATRIDVVALLRIPGFVAINLASVVVNLSSFVVWLLVPYFLSRVAGIDVTLGGAVLSMGAVGGILAALVGGHVIGRIPAAQVAIIGALLVSTGLALAAFWRADTPVLGLVFALTLQGIGVGLFQLAHTDLVTATLPRADRGVAGALALTMRTLGIVSAAVALMPLFAHLEAQMAFLPAFQTLFLALALLPAAMALLLWRHAPR